MMTVLAVIEFGLIILQLQLMIASKSDNIRQIKIERHAFELRSN